MSLRRRILVAYDSGKGTREGVAKRFGVSVGMVKKLLLQRRATGEIGPRHAFSGRKPKIIEKHREQLRRLIAKRPELTLAQLRAATRLNCTLPAIHYVLVEMGLTFKKRRAARSNQTKAATPAQVFVARASSKQR